MPESSFHHVSVLFLQFTCYELSKGEGSLWLLHLMYYVSGLRDLYATDFSDANCQVLQEQMDCARSSQTICGIQGRQMSNLLWWTQWHWDDCVERIFWDYIRRDTCKHPKAWFHSSLFLFYWSVSGFTCKVTRRSMCSGWKSKFSFFAASLYKTLFKEASWFRTCFLMFSDDLLWCHLYKFGF